MDVLDVTAEVVGPEERRRITTLSACSAAEGEFGPAALLSMRLHTGDPSTQTFSELFRPHTHICILKLGSSVQDKTCTCGC